MANPRFFPNHGPFTLSHLLSLAPAEVWQAGVKLEGANLEEALNQSISDVAPLDRAEASNISFIDNPKYKDAFENSQAGFCFTREKFVALAPQGMVLLVAADPYRHYALVAQAFYPRKEVEGFISPHAVVDESAQIASSTYVAPGAVVGKHVRIGERVVIGANSVIEDGVEIGDDTQIGPNSSLSHCTIGKNVIIHRGVQIGQDGFGFALGRAGHVKVPQLGCVVIEDDVEIGSCTCIDRGTGPDTFVGQGAKIDNLVQIAHNVHVGKGAVIVGQAGIAGSTKIGDGAVLAGQAGVAGHLKLGAGCKIAAKAGVFSDVAAGASYGGSPAVPIIDWHRQNITLARLAKQKKTKNEEAS